MRPVEVERLARPRAAHDLEELAGLLVPGVLVVVDAEAGELGRLGAGHDVDEQPAAGDALVRRRHLRRERRREERGPERDEELDAAG